MATTSKPYVEVDPTQQADASGRPAHGATVDEERLEFERQFDRPRVVAGWRELVLAMIALGAWFLLFAGGTLIGTQSYIDALSSTSSSLNMVRIFSVIILFWTITNVGTLSILAAILGAFGQRTRFTCRTTVPDGRPVPAQPVSTDRGSREVYIHYASAVMRGFGVYTLVLSGLLVLATDALISPTQGQYVRLGGMISVVSFYAGYDPETLAGLLERIKRFIKTE